MDFSISAVSLLAVTIGLTELTKRLDVFDSRYLPVVSLFFGVLLTPLFLGFDKGGLFTGIVIGLAGSGLWDVGKQSVLGK